MFSGLFAEIIEKLRCFQISYAENSTNMMFINRHLCTLTKCFIGVKIIGLMLIVSAYAQQTLDEAVNEQLETAPDPIVEYPCALLRQGDHSDDIEFGEQLLYICSKGDPPTPSGGVSSGGSALTTLARSEIIHDRLKTLREEEEQGAVQVAAAGDGIFVSMSDGPQKRLGWYIVASHESLDKQQTPFEAGYDSDVAVVTTGIDYRFNEKIIAGLALNYGRWDGEIDIGGDFDIDSIGLTAYATFVTEQGIFLDTIIEYTHKDYARRRFVSFVDEEQIPTLLLIRGIATADYGGKEYSASLLTGYDYHIDPISVGPRLGIRYLEIKNDAYQESGRFIEGIAGEKEEFNTTTPTGLELAFDKNTIRSLQSVLGFNANWKFKIRESRLIPQISLEWRHEFQDDQRTMDVRFVQDNRQNPLIFDYNNDKPDRDYFYLGGGVSAVFDNGLQASLGLHKMLGHDYYDSTTVTLGLRIDM